MIGESISVLNLPETDAVFEPEVPREVNDLGVEGERNAETGQEDVPDGEVDEQVVSGGPRSLGATARDQEEEVAENGEGDGHHVESDPAPLVLGAQLVARHRRVAGCGAELKGEESFKRDNREEGKLGSLSRAKPRDRGVKTKSLGSHARKQCESLILAH